MDASKVNGENTNKGNINNINRHEHFFTGNHLLLMSTKMMINDDILTFATPNCQNITELVEKQIMFRDAKGIRQKVHHCSAAVKCVYNKNVLQQ